MEIKYELRYGNQVKHGDLLYLKRLAKGLDENWLICYHVLSSMRVDPRARRVSIREMDQIFQGHRKGIGAASLAKEFHLAPDYVQKIINAKL